MPKPFVLVMRALLALPPRIRALCLGMTDAVLMAGMAYAVLALRLGEWLPQPLYTTDPWYLPAVLLVTLPCFVAFRLYRALVRYGGQWILMIVTRAVTVAAAVIALLALALGSPHFPLSVIPLLWGGLLLAAMASRLMLYWALKRVIDVDSTRRRERVAIYGAGRAGVQLLAGLRSSLDHKVVALLDDDPQLRGRHVLGCTIHSPERLTELIEKLGIRRLILAIPSASAERRRDILVRLGEVPIRVQTLPPLSEIIECRVELSQIRDISPEELLWRQPVEPVQGLLDRDVAGKSVMVTGGGGSIGAELCRQILPLKPRRLVVFELGELQLYAIEQELRDSADPATELVFVLGDVCDGRRLEDAMTRHGIETLYHAAAYKHVPIVEANPLTGLVNNAFGTLRAAEAATAAGVAKFVLISTDKAVRPTSVMGASKRLAEMVLQALAARGGPTVFAMVRFGNVINSTGSVVPLFRRQIAAGGPVTVTHEDVVRYFMTIPEAANLVLQAGAMARGGEVFLLDMGEPVRIFDLATRLIHLSGFTVRDEAHPDGDVPIVITGLRPGEKLFEELFIGQDFERTAHPRILKAKEEFLAWEDLSRRLSGMEGAARTRDEQAAVAGLFDTIQAITPVAAPAAALR